jgi:hypothetical protein
MRHRWVVRVFGILLFGVIVVAGFGYAVLALWNWLMPVLFKLPALTFWQAVGLLGLSWILFGSWRGFHRPSRHWRGRMRERWEQMTPEQREEFRKAMESRCGRWSRSSGADPTADSPSG